MSNKPPKIVVPGLNRGAGIPGGYVLGRLAGTGQGPAQLLDLAGLRQVGVATGAAVAQGTASISVVISSSISTVTSSIASLSTAIGPGVSTSLSQISSSLSGAISSTSSLSTAVSTVVSGSISTVTSLVNSLSAAITSSGGGPGPAAFTTPTDALFSITLNAPTITDAVSFNGVSTYRLVGAADASLIRGRMRTLPVGDFTAIIRIEGFYSEAAFNGFGFMFRDTGGKYAFGGMQRPNNSTTMSTLVESWSDQTTFSATIASTGYDVAAPIPRWFKAAFTAATNDIIFSSSFDKSNWDVIGTSTYLGTCDAFGLCVKNSHVSINDTAYFSHWEVA